MIKIVSFEEIQENIISDKSLHKGITKIEKRRRYKESKIIKAKDDELEKTNKSDFKCNSNFWIERTNKSLMILFNGVKYNNLIKLDEYIKRNTSKLNELSFLDKRVEKVLNYKKPFLEEIRRN